MERDRAFEAGLHGIFVVSPPSSSSFVHSILQDASQLVNAIYPTAISQAYINLLYLMASYYAPMAGNK